MKVSLTRDLEKEESLYDYYYILLCLTQCVATTLSQTYWDSAGKCSSSDKLPLHYHLKKTHKC